MNSNFLIDKKINKTMMIKKMMIIIIWLFWFSHLCFFYSFSSCNVCNFWETINNFPLLFA